MSSTVYFKDREIREALGAHLNEMRKCGQLCDWFLKANDNNHPFPVHKTILIAASPYFEELFENKVKERPGAGSSLGFVDPQNSMNLYVPPETEDYSASFESNGSTMAISIVNLEKMLDYIYTGVIEIKYSELLDVWKDANTFQLNSLKMFCLKAAITNIKPETCWANWMQYAHLDDDLDNKMSDCVLENVDYILETEPVEDLEYEQIERLVNKNKTACNIDMRYKFLEKWASVNFCKRVDEFDKLLKYFDFKEFSEDFFRDRVINNDEFKQSNVFLRKIIVSMDTTVCQTTKS